MANWFGKFRDRSIVLWQEGKIDDRAFERAQIVRARKMIAAVFAGLIVLVDAAVVAGNLSDHTPVRLEQLLLVTGILAVFGIVLVFRLGRLALVGARNMVLSRNRARAESQPGARSAQGGSRWGGGASVVAYFRHVQALRCATRARCSVYPASVSSASEASAIGTIPMATNSARSWRCWPPLSSASPFTACTCSLIGACIWSSRPMAFGVALGAKSASRSAISQGRLRAVNGSCSVASCSCRAIPKNLR